MKTARRTLGALCLAALAWLAGCRAGAPLRIVVMDPLAGPLACDCVKGYAQRDYGKLAGFLEGRLRRPVEVAFSEEFVSIWKRHPDRADVVIGKRSLVAADGAAAGAQLRPVAMLTGLDGSTDLHGLFVVRASDPAWKITDLAGRKIVFGPPEEVEKSAAAVAALKARGLAVPEDSEPATSCNAAALAVLEKRADATVISSYAGPLLVGCNVIDEGALRVIGRTAPVPFITVFVTGRVTPEDESAIRRALLAAGQDARLLKAMESKSGFVPLETAK